jgi:WD40 repeat protein
MCIMSCRNRRIAVLLLAGLSFVSLAGHAELPMATDPKECIFFGNPQHRGADYDPDQGLFIMTNDSGVHAFDAHTGAQRWHHRNSSPYVQTHYGRKDLVIFGKDGVFLLDKSSGREIWAKQNTRYSGVGEAVLSPDESAVLVSYLVVQQVQGTSVKHQNICVFYDLKHSRERVLTQLKDAEFAGFLGDGKTIAFFRNIDDALPSHSLCDSHGLKEYFLLDTETGSTTPPHVIPDSDRCIWSGVSPSGLLAVPRYPPENKPVGLRVFDVHTGALVRDLGEWPKGFISPVWMEDEKRIYFATLGSDDQEICVIDAMTGQTNQSLSRPGHSLVKLRIGQSSQGPDMVLSQDKDRNFWYWPPVADATPVKVFDGGRIAPGTMSTQIHNNGYVTTRQNVVGGSMVIASRLPDMQKTAEWRVADSYLVNGELFNQPMTHCVNRVMTGEQRGGEPNTVVEVLANGAEPPLFSGPGTPVALSPDGRYFVVQTDDKTALLQDLEQKKTICAFNQELEYRFDIQAAFSDDGKRLAVNAWPNLEVVDVAPGLPRRKMELPPTLRGFYSIRGTWDYGEGQGMCFSPDGSLLLTGEYGRAWLHDAATGKLLHQFQETNRYLDEYGQGQRSFLRSLAQTAEDWVGVVTDRFKAAHPLYVAFGASGDRVITHTDGQIIRVWDTRSGEQQHAIETSLPQTRDKERRIRNRTVLSDNGDYALAYSRSSTVPASLWSLKDGTLLRRYKFPETESLSIALTDDAKSIYVLDSGDLYRWKGTGN